MVKISRAPVLLAVGLLVGVAAGAIGMMSLRGGDGPYAVTPGQATQAMGAAPASTAFVSAVAGNCDVTPMLPRAAQGDGQASLQARPETANAPEVASLILDGKEAFASGRQHDAEIAFLDACRTASALTDGDPIPLADSMYQLGRLYANAAALGSPQAKPLFQRAERLYSASLEAYRARYGDKGEKTRYAQQGLATVQQATGGKAPMAIAQLAEPPAEAASAPAPATAAGAAPAPPVPKPVAAAAAPSAAAATLAATPSLSAPDPARESRRVAKAAADAERPAPTVHPKARAPLPRDTDTERAPPADAQDIAVDRSDDPVARDLTPMPMPAPAPAPMAEARVYDGDATPLPPPRRARTSDSGDEPSE